MFLNHQVASRTPAVSLAHNAQKYGVDIGGRRKTVLAKREKGLEEAEVEQQTTVQHRP